MRLLASNDLPSRGCSGGDLATAEMWFKGPDFLKESKDKWQQDPLLSSSDNDEAYTEIMKNPALNVHSLSGISINVPLHIEEIIDPQRYSTKVIKVTSHHSIHYSIHKEM